MIEREGYAFSFLLGNEREYETDEIVWFTQDFWLVTFKSYIGSNVSYLRHFSEDKVLSRIHHTGELSFLYIEV